MKMRVRWLIAISTCALFGITACGSDSGAGGRPGLGSGGTDGFEEPEPEPEENIPAEPGTCRKLCCSSADCGLDESCTALDASSGTLGVCSGNGGSIPDGSATEISLPPGCWTLNEAQCNPVTNAGCESGGACDYGPSEDADFEPVVGCFGGDSTQGPGEACDVASGPWCVPGFHCVAN